MCVCVFLLGMTDLHEIRVRLFSSNSECNLERHFTHREPIVVAAGVLLQNHPKFFDFLHEELGDRLTLRRGGLQPAAAAHAHDVPAVALGC